MGLIEEGSGRKIGGPNEPLSRRKLAPPEALEVESSLACGFRQSWLAGTDEGFEFDITCGAGLGSPWLILTVESADGRRREEVIDMRELARDWIASAVAAMEAVETTGGA